MAPLLTLVGMLVVAVGVVAVVALGLVRHLAARVAVLEQAVQTTAAALNALAPERPVTLPPALGDDGYAPDAAFDTADWNYAKAFEPPWRLGTWEDRR